MKIAASGTPVQSPTKLSRILPLLLVALWLVFVGMAIWWRVVQTDVPPQYDALSYLQKAKAFWAAVEKGEPFNPLNLMPVFRPPGTVLMTYPFGFHEDFHWLYLRSVLLPLIGVAGAVYLALYMARLSDSAYWTIAFCAVALTSLPLFYHLERTTEIASPGFWGLVDCFLAGVAALAAGACARAVRRFSPSWFMLALVLAGLCLLIKPAGVLILVLIGAVWFFSGCWLVVRTADRERRTRHFKVLVVTALVGALFDGLLISWTLHSEYLSPQMVAFGQQAMEILRDDLSLRMTLDSAHSLLSVSFGYAVPVGLVVMTLLALRLRRRARTDSAEPPWPRWVQAALAVGAGLCLVVGGWFWLIATDVSQVRYFYPFALCALVFLLPLVFTISEELSSPARRILAAVFLIPSLNLALLLVQARPSLDWQRYSGVNLHSGAYNREVEAAYHLIRTIRAGGKMVKLFSFASSPAVSVFENVGLYEASMRPNQPSYIFQLPMDWTRPTGFRIDEIVNSDFILFEPITSPRLILQAQNSQHVDDYQKEGFVFHAFFSTLQPSDGVKVEIETASRVLRVWDRARLRRACLRLVEGRRWRPEFIEMNAAFLGWMREQIANRPPGDEALQPMLESNAYPLSKFVLGPATGGNSLVRLFGIP